MKGAIFDLDGTLLDSMPGWDRMWTRFLEDFHLPKLPHFLQDVTPIGAVGTAEYLQRLGLDMDTQAIIDLFQARIFPAYQHEILPKDYAVAYLDSLLDKGVKLCVLTATPEKNFLPCLERTGLLDKFVFTCCCNDVGIMKSDPAVYALMAKRLDLPLSDIAFFDDNVGALIAAHEAGVYTVGVYDEVSAADRPQIEAVVDRYITSFSELL